MASTHKHIRSGTANKRPTTAIADGQIALNTNTTSPGLYFKDSTGATIIKIGPVHVGSTAPNVSPPAGGSAGNSTGEIWLDISLTPNGVKIWNGSAWVNATPVGSTTVQGLLELATNAETQTGSDTDRAVTPAGLQSKVSDSTSTTSSTTIASSTAVKSAYDLANAALPKSGGTVTGNLEIGTTGSLSFEGATADAFETTIAVVDPTADRTITLPDTTGTIVTTGDTGTVTSTMIADGTIVNADINASAAIAHNKLANITAGQVLLGNASNVPTATALSGDVVVDSSGVTAISSGVIVNADVNASAAIAGTKISPDFGSQTIATTGIVSHALGTAGAPTVTFTGDTNTGVYSPGADQVAISTNGTERLRIDSTGQIEAVSLGTAAAPTFSFTGDPNTGIYSPGADQLAVATNGVERVEFGTAEVVFNDGGTDYDFRVEGDTNANLLFVDASTDRVGIGTGSVNTKLEIAGNNDAVTENNTLRFTDTDANTEANQQIGKIEFYSSDASTPGAGVKAYIGAFATDTTPDAYLAFATQDGGVVSTPVERVRITSDGKVGIGTLTPGYRLHVEDNSTGVQQRISSSSSSGTSFSFVNTAASGRNYRIGSNFVTGNGEFAIYDDTASASRIFVSSSGNVGIGTQSPGATLDVAPDANRNLQVQGKSGTTYGLEIKNGTANSGGEFHITAASSGGIVFNRGTSEMGRFDSSSRLLVGTSSTSVGCRQVLEGSSGGLQAGIQILAANTSSPADNSALGGIYFCDNTHASGLGICADIFCRRDGGSWNASSKPTRLVFSTTPDGLSSPTERIRIDSEGRHQLVSAGSSAFTSQGYGWHVRSTNYYTAAIEYEQNSAAGEPLNIFHRATSGNNNFILFKTEAGAGTTRGSITYNRAGGLTAYNTTSDYRAKTLFGDLENPGETIDALKVYRGVMNGATVERPMLVAHEAQEVAPYCVTGEKDAVNDDGKPIYQQMDHQALVPLLIAEIQQLRARVAALESA